MELAFNPPLDIPLWAESLEFWSHGDGRTHRFRLSYRDEGGVHYYIEFPARAYRGWQRFAATIPQRIEMDRPFAERYRRLRLVSLIILDSGPGRIRDRPTGPATIPDAGRITRYHFASFAAARIRRTLENEREWWAFRRIYGFERLDIPALTVRFYGMTNQRIESLAYPSTNGTEEDGYLSLRAGLVRGGPRRIILRFPAPLPTGVCRMLVLTVHGNARRERLLLLTRNYENRHFLFDLGRIGFSGPRKLYLRVPESVVQGSRNIAAEKGLLLLELIIEPEADAVGEVLLGLDNLAVIEDIGEYLFEGVELLDQWGRP
jgi:hypothetical protein